MSLCEESPLDGNDSMTRADKGHTEIPSYKGSHNVCLTTKLNWVPLYGQASPK